MLELLMGAAGFILYLLYDVNSYTRRSALLSSGFLAGSLLVAAATAVLCLRAWKAAAFSGAGDVVLLLLGLLMLAAMLYCLFFALPFEETYTKPVNGRKVYPYGVYALCRHPGVICFFFFYLFLGLAALPAGLIVHGMIFSGLNVGYAWFQDRITFRKTFCDYEAYARQVPFLLPTKRSICRAVETWGWAYDKGGDL